MSVSIRFESLFPRSAPCLLFPIFATRNITINSLPWSAFSAFELKVDRSLSEPICLIFINNYIFSCFSTTKFILSCDHFSPPRTTLYLAFLLRVGLQNSSPKLSLFSFSTVLLSETRLMSPFGLVINSFIITSCVVFFAECTPSPFSVSCPNDWSIDPAKDSGNSAPMVHCWDPSLPAPSSCYASSCINHPVCNTCTDVETGELVEQVQCTKEYHAGDGSTVQTSCVDSKNRYLSCSGTCTGSLTCSQCFNDPCQPKFKTQLQRRANPFSASMGVAPGSGHAGASYFGDNFNLRK